jgi:hypothetical protein
MRNLLGSFNIAKIETIKKITAKLTSHLAGKRKILRMNMLSRREHDNVIRRPEVSCRFLGLPLVLYITRPTKYKKNAG